MIKKTLLAIALISIVALPNYLIYKEFNKPSTVVHETTPVTSSIGKKKTTTKSSNIAVNCAVFESALKYHLEEIRQIITDHSLVVLKKQCKIKD